MSVLSIKDYIGRTMGPLTVSWRYNAVQYNAIFHAALQLPRHYINQNMYSRKTPHTSPVRASYGLWGVFCEEFREKWPRHNGAALHKERDSLTININYLILPAGSLQIRLISPLMIGHLAFEASMKGGRFRGVPLYFNRATLV